VRTMQEASEPDHPKALCPTWLIVTPRQSLCAPEIYPAELLLRLAAPCRREHKARQLKPAASPCRRCSGSLL
jgi:hypothetical protein